MDRFKHPSRQVEAVSPDVHPEKVDAEHHHFHHHPSATRADDPRHPATVCPCLCSDSPTRSGPEIRLLEVAVENAVEGCVRETFGVAVAMIRAERAGDKQVRRAMRSIARDEMQHAELSWAVARWTSPPASIARCSSTRGLRLYVDPIDRAFGGDVDYAQIVKEFDGEPAGAGRYSPPRVISVEKTPIIGQPISELLSHVAGKPRQAVAMESAGP
jgi:hypothetical protein